MLKHEKVCKCFAQDCLKILSLENAWKIQKSSVLEKSSLVLSSADLLQLEFNTKYVLDAKV